MHWFTRAWWKYLLGSKDPDVGWMRAIVCRIKAHPYPVIWYTISTEPDMHCNNCGDDLG